MVGKTVDYPRSFSVSRCAALLLAILLAPGCAGRDSDPLLLTAEVPLHLEDHLDAAIIEGSEAPADLPEVLEWRFDEPQPEWKAIGYAESQPVRLTPLDDALRLDITEANYYTPRPGCVHMMGGSTSTCPTRDSKIGATSRCARELNEESAP